MQKGYNIPSKKLGEARKKIKFDPEVLKSKEISEFDTHLPEFEEKAPTKAVTSNELDYSIGIEQEKKRNKDLLANLLQPVAAIKHEAAAQKNTSATDQSNQQQQQSASKSTPKHPKETVSGNWKQFLLQSKKSTPSVSPGKHSAPHKIANTEYVALDCQFVECEDGEQLARISIVNEHLEELFESYIRPCSKIVDYRTHVSGITYGHIKKAPMWEGVKYQVEKILVRKCVVGHTLWKDLEVMGMSKWSGFKTVIDISKYSQYQENGKLQSLKRLALVFLEKEIQTGAHSSLQDAKATMSLFLLRKQKILSQIERNRKLQLRQQSKREREQPLEEGLLEG